MNCRVCGKSGTHVCEEIDVLRLANRNLRAKLAALRNHAGNLSEIVRMPNAEHVADAHNAAVRAIKTALAEGGE